MELSRKEFRAMNNPLRRFVQRTIEFPIFRRFGLGEGCGRVLEIGCGSGYGAVLIGSLSPDRYLGIDVMPEQIRLAQGRGLEGFEFQLGDATDLSFLRNGSFDTVVVFGILHHIPEWRKAIREISRVLRSGGSLFVEEPDGDALEKWDRLVHWGHAGDKDFGLGRLEEELAASGLRVKARRYMIGFGWYAAVKDGGASMN